MYLLSTPLLTSMTFFKHSAWHYPNHVTWYITTITWTLTWCVHDTIVVHEYWGYVHYNYLGDISNFLKNSNLGLRYADRLSICIIIRLCVSNDDNNGDRRCEYSWIIYMSWSELVKHHLYLNGKHVWQEIKNISSIRTCNCRLLGVHTDH